MNTPWVSVFCLAFLARDAAFTQSSADKVVPSVYSGIGYDEKGWLYFSRGKERYYADTSGALFSIEQMVGKPVAAGNGIVMDFDGLKGSITYGLIPYGKAVHPLPIFRYTKSLNEGKAEINIIHDFRDPYDFVDWKENEHLTIGYRLMDTSGLILFDGEVSVKGRGPFEITPAMLEGPFVSNIGENTAEVWCRTTLPVVASVSVNGRTYSDTEAGIFHHWRIDGLAPEKTYPYAIHYAGMSQQYHLKTAPRKGSRRPFIFGYTSDSRHATGGGERKIYGANGYIMKKVAALALQQNAAFVQFTGDMINGYLTHAQEQHLQYTNWKKSIEPFWHYIPFYAGIGNHEALGYLFRNANGDAKAFIDGFPYETHSAEAAFAEAFVNPVNGPVSEDGSKYDPDPDKTDFPSYRENVFYYTYGNVAMIVLNSDYWYAPTLSGEPATSGGLHGYIMDNQLQWLRQTIDLLEKDKSIDHVFVTQHTPVFPNGGHSGDDMWYHGNNAKRPFVAGKPVDVGILQRRDQYLDILINHSSKVVAVLTGDEHNYNWLKLTDEVIIYPEDYPYPKLRVSRPIYQINNGAAGAPYYGQEVLPWSGHTRSFSVENALCLFSVAGKRITMRVLNPDTLNEIDHVVLR